MNYLNGMILVLALFMTAMAWEVANILTQAEILAAELNGETVYQH